MRITGKKALMECLKAEGIKNIYGNPGTSEGPLMEEIINHKLILLFWPCLRPVDSPIMK